MAADGKPNGLEVPEPIRPYIAIVFAGEGAADMAIHAPKITPAQLYAAAFYLTALADQTYSGIAQKAALTALQAAPASILEDLRRSGRV